VTVLKPATDRIQFFGALTGNITDGKSTVFDTKYVSLRGNADWSLSRWDSVYLGAEYRSGDTVGTAAQQLKYAGISPNIQDDAFTDTTRIAYRFKARTWVATLGYNRAFGERHSLDFSWRRVQATPTGTVAAPATTSDLSYAVNQFSIAYLARF
jgi:hypothetical protein